MFTGKHVPALYFLGMLVLQERRVRDNPEAGGREVERGACQSISESGCDSAEDRFSNGGHPTRTSRSRNPPARC